MIKPARYLEDLEIKLPFFEFQIMQNKFPVPTSQNVSAAVLDHYTRGYLQKLVDHKIVVSGVFRQ